MIEQTIIEKIKEINDKLNIYHDFAPQNAQPPLVVLSRVGGAGNRFLDRETTGGYEIRVQVSVWATDRVTAIKISRAIEQTLFRLPELSSNGAAVATYDPETDWRGMRQDFLIFETE